MLSLNQLLDKQLHVTSKTPLILSVSGGVDSMVMLDLFRKSTYNIIVVHFNHQKRDASIIEKDLVERVCKAYNIPFYYFTIKVSKGNFHHQAHLLRTHHLNEVAKLNKARYIFTAHHLDDLLENVLIKLTRGSNLLGYAGMQHIHETPLYTYVKPLLYTSKHEIMTYAKKHDVLYLEDSSNEENGYLRNRYRHAVVPLMKQENEMLLDQIKQYHLQLSSAFFHIRGETKKLIKNHKIMINQFISWDGALQDDAIAYVIESENIPITYDKIQKIKGMLLNNKPNASYRLNHVYAFIKSYQEAFIKPLTEIDCTKYTLNEGTNYLKNVAIFTLLSNSGTITEEFIKLCYNKLAFPLTLRHRQDGDELHYDYGHKKLKKLLIDKKIPMLKRQQLWVLTDSHNTILWVQDLYVNQTLGDQHVIYFHLNEVKKDA